MRGASSIFLPRYKLSHALCVLHIQPLYSLTQSYCLDFVCVGAHSTHQGMLLPSGTRSVAPKWNKELALPDGSPLLTTVITKLLEHPRRQRTHLHPRRPWRHFVARPSTPCECFPRRSFGSMFCHRMLPTSYNATDNPTAPLQSYSAFASL